MVKHIVMFKFKENALGMDKKELLEKTKEKIMGLTEKVEVLRNMEVGIDFLRSDASYDLVLIATLDNKEDLDIYAKHEDHLEVIKFIKQVITSRVAVDYEI